MRDPAGSPPGGRIGNAVVLGVVAIGLAFTWFAAHQTRLANDRSSERALAARANLIQVALRDRLLTYEAVVHAGVGLFGANQGVSAEAFRTFVNQLQLAQSHPGLQALGFARRTRAATVDATPSDETSDENRDVTFIEHLEPLDERNRAALGFDMMSETVRRRAMEHARDTGRVVLSGGVTLVHEIVGHKQSGFLIYAPIYASGTTPTTIEERRKALVGYIYCAFRAGDFLPAVLGDAIRDLLIEVLDREGDETHVLYTTREPTAPAPANVVARRLRVLDHEWRLEVAPLPAFHAGLNTTSLPLVWATGGAATLLLALLVWALARSREHLSARLEAERRQQRQIELLNSTLEQRVKERTRELDLANRELHAANAQLEAFAQDVSHDLRAPLRAIEGYTQLVLEEHGAGLDGVARTNLIAVTCHARKMQRLIDDMLRLAFVGHQPIARRTINLWTLVLGVLGDLTKPEGTIVHARPDELGDVFADPNLLEHAMRNLLSNAIKFSRRAKQPTITIGSQLQAGERVYYVRDNGVGFDAARAEELFEAFHRLHRDQEFEGTGVGLTIVKNVIERHGGRIWADAAVGRGATFYFTLSERP